MKFMRSTTSSNGQQTTGKPPGKRRNRPELSENIPKHPQLSQNSSNAPGVSGTAPLCPAPHFQGSEKETITLHVSRESDLESRQHVVGCKLTPTEHREFKKLARNIGQTQLLRILIKQALTKAKSGGLQITLDL